ncbi:MAG TPA: M13 family metallopeptidase [Steroidobacteraceae bacterium]|nr:M13 family metallopeptidase [Steroidobacteraceae bacterium]
MKSHRTRRIAALALLAAASAASAAPVSGVDGHYVDAAVRPQDDIYRHLNGKWLDTWRIPADKSYYATFTAVADQTQRQLKGIVDGLAGGGAGGADARKLADFYASFMDVKRLDALGLAPLRSEFRRVDAIAGKGDLADMFAHLNRTEAAAPFDLGIDQDARDSTRYAVTLAQSGLGMPDRDYYLSDNAKLRTVRAKYLAHIEKMFTLAGLPDAAGNAAAILKLETAMAKIQWTRVENRDPLKIYNKTTIGDLPALMPNYAWNRYLAGTGLAHKIDYVIVNQPSYFSALGKLIAQTPLSVWKAYFKWHLLSAMAPYLSQPFVDERFAFAGTVLRGVPRNEPRWKRGLTLLNTALGEALGRLYVEKYFPPQNKARIGALVHNLIETYRREIGTLDWMSPPTRKGALAKLEKLAVKVGYPEKWRDYTALRIRRDDLFGNVMRADEFQYRYDLAKLGKPIDRTEWQMTPQTVNAYYNPLMNEIVFPAAILQPPFFNVQADDAVNYGGIGGVIGHEISHAFDDEGSQFDADGNLHDWFTPADHAKFAAKTRALVAQYARYEPVPGFHVNGKLTLGENIADNSGIAIAYKAYRRSLDGKRPPVIDGMTGDQRFFYGWVQVWRGKARKAQAILWLKSDPHSPFYVRGSAPLRNQAAFYRAFGVSAGDKMYLPPDRRVTIW